MWPPVRFRCGVSTMDLTHSHHILKVITPSCHSFRPLEFGSCPGSTMVLKDCVPDNSASEVQSHLMKCPYPCSVTQIPSHNRKSSPSKPQECRSLTALLGPPYTSNYQPQMRMAHIQGVGIPKTMAVTMAAPPSLPKLPWFRHGRAHLDLLQGLVSTAFGR